MIKVLMLVPNLRVSNGVVSFVMNYYRNVDHNKIRVDFALYDDPPSPYYDEIRENSKIYLLPPVKSWREHIECCKKILAENYDIIHDNLLHISIPMMWCAKVQHVPVRILHSHSAKMGATVRKEVRNKLFLPILRGLATNYMACSEMAGRAMFKKGSFKIVPNVISTKKYNFKEDTRFKIRKQMGVVDKFVVGTVGRLAEEKNPYFAISVFEKLVQKEPNIEYWWIGSGGLDTQVKEYVESCGVSEYIKLLGSRSDVPELYQAMDCFFLPSLFEGLPVTGIEAQAMGLPIVASDAVTKEMVYTDLVDYVSLHEPAEVWVEHLNKALSRNVDRKVSVNLLRQSAFSDVGCGDRLLGIYQKMLQKRNV